MSPTGNIIRGHVLDCSVGPLVERLRDIDPQLFVTWNPRKLRGWGFWEIRRRPDFKTVKDVVEYGGNTYVVVDYVGSMIVREVPFLNYRVLEDLKASDMWSISRDPDKLIAEMDYREAKHKEKIKASAEEEKAYGLKQQKSAVRDLMNYTLSGGDPSRIANYWPKG